MKNYANILRYAPVALKSDGATMGNSGDITGVDLRAKGGVKLPEQAQRSVSRKKRTYAAAFDKK